MSLLNGKLNRLGGGRQQRRRGVSSKVTFSCFFVPLFIKNSANFKGNCVNRRWTEELTENWSQLLSQRMEDRGQTGRELGQLTDCVLHWGGWMKTEEPSRIVEIRSWTRTQKFLSFSDTVTLSRSSSSSVPVLYITAWEFLTTTTTTAAAATSTTTTVDVKQHGRTCFELTTFTWTNPWNNDEYFLLTRCRILILCTGWRSKSSRRRCCCIHSLLRMFSLSQPRVWKMICCEKHTRKHTRTDFSSFFVCTCIASQ